MAITTTPAVAPFGAVAIHRAIGALSALVAAISDWNDARRTADALRYLKADLLDDIGLTQGDIVKFGRNGY
jgi:uncharacterized protein YjiS (DUF1127 family)